TSDLCPDYGIASNIQELNYTPINELCMDGIWYWQVRAFDGQEYGEWSDKWNFTIEPVIILSMTTSTIDFGLMEINESKDTDNGYSALVVQNDGNVMANITWISTNSTIWTTVSDNTEYFRFKVDNDETEANSFSWADSQTTWRNFTTIDYFNSTAIALLNYSDANDNAEIDLNLTVPPQEPPDSRFVSIYIIGQET
ncbi:MAG: hypothetical protein V1859_02830, partial [archaeon]